MAGIPLAHHLLKHTPASVGLCVVLVSPNDEMLWPYATVRAVVPGLLDDNKVFPALGSAFSKYEPSKFEHVVGFAQGLEPETNRIIVSANVADRPQRIIEHNTLVIVTGSSCKDDMPFKSLSNTETTKQGMQSLRERTAAARSSVVAGTGLRVSS